MRMYYAAYAIPVHGCQVASARRLHGAKLFGWPQPLRLWPSMSAGFLEIGAIRRRSNAGRRTVGQRSHHIGDVGRAQGLLVGTWQSDTAKAVNCEIHAKGEMMFMMPTAQALGSGQALAAERSWRMTRTMYAAEFVMSTTHWVMSKPRLCLDSMWPLTFNTLSTLGPAPAGTNCLH